MRCDALRFEGGILGRMRVQVHTVGHPACDPNSFLPTHSIFYSLLVWKKENKRNIKMKNKKLKS